MCHDMSINMTVCLVYDTLSVGSESNGKFTQAQIALFTSPRTCGGGLSMEHVLIH